MTNGIDVTQLAIDVACCVAMAQFDELEAQSFRLRDMVDDGLLEKQRAVDMLYRAAIASDLVRVHGNDIIQESISIGFMEVFE